MQEQNQTPENVNNLEPEKSTEEILTEQIEDLQKQIENTKDQLIRKIAEFDNYKRRTDNDQLNLVKFANENLITQLLPIIEDFTRIIKSSEEHSENEQFFKGVELVYTKLIKSLESKGLKTFDSIGKEFNVELHDAILLTPNATVEPNTIVEEIEKGFMFHDKVIRHAKVIVATLPESEEKI